MAASFDPVTITASAPRVLAQTRIVGAALTGFQYGVAPDGRFIVNALTKDAAPLRRPSVRASMIWALGSIGSTCRRKFDDGPGELQIQMVACPATNWTDTRASPVSGGPQIPKLACESGFSLERQFQRNGRVYGSAESP
jgi:hypothetical protein